MLTEMAELPSLKVKSNNTFGFGNNQISHLHTSAVSVSLSCYEFYMSIMVSKEELCFTERRRVLSSLETPGSLDCLSVCLAVSCSVPSPGTLLDFHKKHLGLSLCQTLVKSKVEALKCGPTHQPACTGRAEV